jgi:hypothetical protein
LYWFCRRCWREVPSLQPECKRNTTISRSSLSQFEPVFDLHTCFKNSLIDDEMITDTFR